MQRHVVRVRWRVRVAAAYIWTTNNIVQPITCHIAAAKGLGANMMALMAKTRDVASMKDNESAHCVRTNVCIAYARHIQTRMVLRTPLALSRVRHVAIIRVVV